MNPCHVRATARWVADRGSPRGDGLPPMLRRRCSMGTRAAADAIAELTSAGLPIAATTIVHATALGELATTIELLDMIREQPPAPSPTKFATSVHNAAVGQLSIALGHTGSSTTVSAGARTVAAAWLEAFATLHDGAEHVLLVVVDEPTPSRLTPHHDGVAIAWWLTGASSDADMATVRWCAPARDVPPCGRVPAPLARAALRFAWPIAEATSGAAGEPGVECTLRLEPDDDRGLAASLLVTRHDAVSGPARGA